MKTRTAIVAVALAAVSAPAVSAAQDAAEARVAFQEGVRQYAAHRYAEALEAFRHAYRVRPHPSVLVNIANCFLALDQPQQAVTTFERYLADNPTLTPEQRTGIETAMADARRHLSTLQVLVQPSGAEVYLDGDLVGTSPLRRSLQSGPGPHVLEARIQGGVSQQFQVRVEPGGSVTVTLDLIAGRSYIGSAPSPAEPVAVAVPAAVATVVPPRPEPAPLGTGEPGVGLAPAVPTVTVTTSATRPREGEHPTEAPSRGIRTLTWIGGALTVAAAGVWVGFAVYSNSLTSDYNQTVSDFLHARDMTSMRNAQRRGYSIADAIDQNNNIAYVFAGVTAAAGVFTVVTILWPRGTERAPAGGGSGAGLSLLPMLTTPGAVLSGRF